MTSFNTEAVTNLGIGRTPEMQAAYQASLAEKRAQFGDNVPCPFDRDIPGGLEDSEIVDEINGIIIATNKFPYKAYDGLRVDEQYLIFPEEHVSDIHELPRERADAFNEVMTRVRTELGWSSYIRADQDPTKSVKHVHGHGFVYGPRITMQYYDLETGQNIILFKGEEDKIPLALGRAGLVITHESA